MSERFQITNIDEALKILENKDLTEVISKFKKDIDAELNFTGLYVSRKDLEDSIKDRVYDYFNTEYNELKSKISYLRKHGEDVNIIDFGLLMVPSKIKVLDAEFLLSNYNIILDMIKKTKKDLTDYNLEDY